MLENNYPDSVSSEDLNNIKLRRVGVHHNPDFYRQHRDFFEKEVSDADSLIIEQSLRVDFWDSLFYGKLAEQAREEEKIVYQVDPLTKGTLNMRCILEPISVFLLPGLCISGISKDIKKAKKGEKIPRRKFLKHLLYSTISFSLASGSMTGSGLKDWIDPDIRKKYGAEDIFKISPCDYRNIVIANGIQRLSKEVDEGTKLTSFHGETHFDPVGTYLHSAPLRFKRAAYFLYDLVSNPKIREYSPSKNGWKLVRSF